jgi:hypothetical protein
MAGGATIVPAALAQTADDYRRTTGGLTIYLGVMPAEIIKGLPAMHGDVPAGPHEYHVVTAIFDATSGARVSDATVTAKVSGLGLSGPERTLEPSIADTITYGGFFSLPGRDLYTIELAIRRSLTQQPVVVAFKYDHRGR